MQREHAAAAVCPMHAPRPLAADDELVLPLHQRVVAQYADDGAELRLYYDDKEISFDEPELFAFGETLAKQSRFAAGAATGWGPGYDWQRVRPLLAALVDEGVLQRADAAPAQPRPEADRPSPLAPATCTAPRDWNDGCEAIVRELTGRPLELGWLELAVPIFRVAHMALDADGRQVGESNVFPPALRLDVPTRWRTCIYSGTRFQSDRPMNVSALKAMRQHWGQMMAALSAVRAAYLRRFPEAAAGWTVGHVERLSTAVLALPTYALMRAGGAVANGALHPALSSLFRVTDGLRMTMHQMLFVPVGEPTLAADAPVDAAAIVAYAERNYSFHSEHGVCAGPRSMIEQFLAVVVDGAEVEPVALDPAVRAALADVEPALDYALLGLRAYAALFSLWPAMTRTYEELLPLAGRWAAANAGAAPLRERLRAHVDALRSATYLANEGWRVDRERVFEDMYAQCGRGLALAGPTLAEQTAPSAAAIAASTPRLAALLERRWGAGAEALAACLASFCVREQALLRAACDAQRAINRLLGRAAPKRPFDAVDADLHNALQGSYSRRKVPDLVAEFGALLEAEIRIDEDAIVVVDAPTRTDPAPADGPPDSSGMVPREQRAVST